MDLEKIEVGGLEAGEGSFDGVENGLAGESYGKLVSVIFFDITQVLGEGLVYTELVHIVFAFYQLF